MSFCSVMFLYGSIMDRILGRIKSFWLYEVQLGPPCDFDPGLNCRAQKISPRDKLAGSWLSWYQVVNLISLSRMYPMVQNELTLYCEKEHPSGFYSSGKESDTFGLKQWDPAVPKSL